MKRACLLFLFIGLYTCGKAQNPNIDNLRQRLYGIWQNVADSNDRLIITPDYIQQVDSGIVRISYSYTFSNEACNNGLKLPAATGVYLVERHNNETVCCALGEVGYATLKITYPAGKQVTYAIKSDLPPGLKKQ